jgi:hypothetical protein
MRFVCDAAKGRTWFQIETEVEAEAEAALMRHAVDKYFLRSQEAARKLYRPPPGAGIERDIGLKAHIERLMPRFLTLRADDGAGLATAMLPPIAAANAKGFRVILVGPENGDPYAAHADAIEALAKHVGYPLPREACYPYK